MTLRDLLLDALRALWAHKVRTGLTMFGIAWGIVSITLMVAAGEGLRVGQKKQADTLGKDLLIVFAGRTSLQAGGVRAGHSIHWQDTDHIAVKAEATACHYVMPELGNDLAVRSAFNGATLLITGSLPGFEDLRSIPVGEGRFYNEADQAEGRRVAFLGSDAKKWATDVPTYVQYGAADLGIAGGDVLAEHGGSGLYQPLDLKLARCRLMVAVRRGFDYEQAVRQGARLRVATKYLQTAREHFAAKGVHVDLIKLYGSMELTPLTGLADAIVDLVSTGNTLQANDLIAVEEVAQISARLIINQAAFKLKRAVIQPVLDALTRAVK